MSIERRLAVGRVAFRKAEDQPSVISGMGAVYNSETVIGGWFRESIAPGAFAPAIGPTADIRSLFNHDNNRVLGRTAAGTLRVTDTEAGLAYEVDVNPSDPEAVSVAAKIGRGDVTGSSFGFRVKRDEWVEPDEGSNDLPLRIIHEFAEIIDVGPVTFPAYEDTTSEARDRAASIRSAREARQTAESTAVRARAEERQRQEDEDRFRRLRFAAASR